jgi:hypothetical protein
MDLNRQPDAVPDSASTRPFVVSPAQETRLTGDHVVVGAHQNGVDPPEFANGCRDLSDVPGCMRTRVDRPRQEPFDRPALDLDIDEQYPSGT